MTDQEVLTLLQYQLVEPVDGGASWLSGLWTRDEVLMAFNTRLRQYLRDTQAIVTRIEIPVAANTNPVTLPADWIATLAGMWRTLAGDRTPLTTADVYEADLGLPTWEATAAVPQLILDEDGEMLTTKLAPIPIANGFFELLYIALPVEATGNGVDLLVPDEILDQVRYGTLADLLGKVGRGSDPLRASYCQDRFELGELLTEIILGGWA